MTHHAARIAATKENIHPDAHWAIDDWAMFPWHTDSARQPDSHVAWSSQAFCVSVWGTIASPNAERLREAVGSLFDDVAAEALIATRPAIEFEVENGSLLNEAGHGKPTNLDVVLTTPGLKIAIESKLTEAFGHCRQPPTACTGRYEPGSDIKTRTSAACRLTVPDGRRTPRRYFEVMNGLAGHQIPTGIACPFAGSGYQVMRTIATAAQMGQAASVDWRAVFALPVLSHPRSVAAVDAIRGLLRPGNAQRVLLVDYADLASTAESVDDAVGLRLAAYMHDRLAHASGR